MVCTTAIRPFLNILITISGPKEWIRAIHLLSRVLIVKDIDSNGDEILPMKRNYCDGLNQKHNCEQSIVGFFYIKF